MKSDLCLGGWVVLALDPARIVIGTWLERDWISNTTNVIGFYIFNENESSMKNASQNIEFSWTYTFVAPEEHQIRHAPTNLEFPRRSFAKVARAPRVTSFRLKIIFFIYFLFVQDFFHLAPTGLPCEYLCSSLDQFLLFLRLFSLFLVVTVVVSRRCFSLHLISPGHQNQ